MSMKTALGAVWAVFGFSGAFAGQATFVESTGNQHFDTGIVPTSVTRIVADVQYVEAPSSGVAVNGWQSSGSQEVFTFGINAGKFQTGVGDNNQWQNSNVTADTARHTFDIQSGSQKLDGNSIGTGTISDKAEAGQTITFFARHGEWITPAQIGNWIKMRLYRCQIYSGETLVRDYVPWCEKGIFGLYDRKNKTFAGPTGGSPLRGVVYQRLDYVESTGREFLDTGYVPNAKTHLVADVQYLNPDAGSMMLNGWAAKDKGEVFCFGVSSGNNFEIGLGDQETGSFLDVAKGDKKRRVFDIQNGSQKFGTVGHGTTNLTEVGTLTFSKANLESWKTIYLFGRHGEWIGGPYRTNNHFKMRFYGMRIEEDGKVVRDFVPAARNGVAGILDDVTGEFKAALRGTLKTSGIAISERAYIDATGAQYIDTGIEPTANTRIVADVQFNNISLNQLMGWAGSSSEAILFGAKGNPKNLAGCVVPSGYWSIFDATNGTTAVANDFRRHVWDLQSGSQKLDGVELTGTAFGTGTIGSTASPGQSMYIFARHAEWLTNEGQLSDLCNARLYSFKIYEGATLVRDYVPCTGNGIPGLYDKVSKVFYASASTALCVAPSAPEYDKLFYVEADGKQYFDTGVVAKPSIRVVADMRFLKLGLGNQMMGWAALNPEEAILFGTYADNNFGGYFTQNYSSPWSSSFAADTDRHVFDFRNGSQKVGDVEIGTDTMLYPLCPIGTLCLFGRHTEWNSFIDWFCHARMYSCQIYDGDELIRDYVPAKVNGRACLYDKVNQCACFSESVTDFIAGEHSDRGIMMIIR